MKVLLIFISQLPYVLLVIALPQNHPHKHQTTAAYGFIEKGLLF